jgi:hypothetical protein
MAAYKLIAADSHIVEPPDMYSSRIDPMFRDRAPRKEHFETRLKGIAMLNVDDVDDACQELKRCTRLGLVGAFIPVVPLADQPYRHPIYEKL